MLQHPTEVAAGASKLASQDSSWQPVFEVISLACEISAYAPDEGRPLF